MKNYLKLFLVILCFFSLNTKTFAFSGVGSGTPEDPYQITTCTQLQEMNDAKSANYILTNDIDFSGIATSTWNSGAGFVPIGSSTTPFTGNLDGKGYKITGLYINRPSSTNVGLFGYVNSAITVIKNIGLENVDITGYQSVGGVAGSFYGGGEVSGVYVTGRVANIFYGAGGIIGNINNLKIYNSYSRANVTGNRMVGGAIGKFTSGTVVNIYSTGFVQGAVGWESEAGGLSGSGAGVYTNSFWDKQTSNQPTRGNRGTGKTTLEMKTIGTFTEASWNINKIWSIDSNGIINDGYPYLDVFADWTDTYTTVTLSGTGTTTNPYIITTCNQLQNIKDNLSSYYELGNNIDCSTYSYNGDWFGFLQIGTSTNPFTGVLDGKGYKIIGLYINRPVTDNVGLFGYVNLATAVIKNVGLENIDITGNSQVGGIVGKFLGGGNISNSYTTGKISGITYAAGGLAGDINGSYVYNSYSRANVTGGRMVGGVIGLSSGATLTNLYSTGFVQGAVGWESEAGGLSGSGAGTNSFWDKQTSNQLTSGGGTGKTTLEMQTQSTFTNWDFTTIPIWTMIDYPYLKVMSKTLIYSANTGGTIIGTTTQITTNGGNGTQVTAVPNTGFSFTSWSDGSTSTSRIDLNITTNATYTASFITSTYSLIYVASTGGIIVGTSTQSINYGSNGTEVVATPNTGYHFVSWSDGVLTASRTDLNIIANLSVTADFAVNNYTIIYIPGSNGSITGSSTQIINYGSNGTEVIASPSVGYHFISWSDGVLTTSRTDTSIIDNITVTANFAINTYTLIYTSGGNGSITGSSTQTIDYGSNGIEVEAVPDADYRFVQWSDGSTSTTRTDLNITNDIGFTAEFVINQRTLVYTPGSNGSITGTTTQTVTIGEDGTTVTAVPNTGYHFVSWSDDVLTASRTDINIVDSINVVASFSINTYTLEYNVDTGGTISGSSTQIINYGSNGTLVTAVADSRYRFLNWSDGDTSTTRTDTNITEDLTITALFRRRSSGVYHYSTCDSFEYTEWNSCKNEIQTRDIINSYPQGCLNGEPITYRECDTSVIEVKINLNNQATTTQQISTTTKVTIDILEISNKKFFTKDLEITDIDEEVRQLQKFLNSEGFIVSLTGPGSIGKETNIFGSLTKKALVRYQEAYAKEILTPIGLKKGTGYFGKATREFMNREFK